MKTKFLALLLLCIALKVNAQSTKEPEKEKSKATLDQEFVTGSKIELNSLTPMQTDNLALLGKVWGFLKYHHPAIAKGNYNWDFELFRITPKLLVVKTVVERNELLTKWITDLGTFKTAAPQVIAPAQVKYKPNFDWFNTSGLSKALVSQLNLIKIADRTEDHYYVKLYDAETPIAIFRNEAAYANFKYPDAGYRLLALFKFWSIFEYFAPYKNLTDKPWGNVIKEYVPKFIAAKDELSYKLTVAALVAEIKDSHADISPYDNAFRNFYGTYKPNIEIVFVDQAPVVSYSNDQVIGLNSLKKGDVIQSINNVPVAQLMKEKLPYITASNYPTQLRKLALQLLRTPDTLMRVSYLRNSKVEQTTLKCFPYNRRNYTKTQPADTGFKIIDTDVAYIHPGRLNLKSLKAVMEMAMKTKAMVIDMRTYPKQSNFVWEIGKYLFTQPMDIAKYTAGSTTTPGLFTYMPDDYMKVIRIGETRTDNYKGKLMVLINEETQSLAELSVMALSTRPNTVIVGSQTAGADGTVGMPVTFPGGIASGFTQIGVYYPNGKETQRIGIVPNVVVKPTAKGIAADKDEVLEKAIALINNKK
ncbi:S41 family peptidase [Pedobacter sp. Hv1]|uniref:S41 family peptidase n=1 Tax=Pedobacter sp. Hv1 TaxID=1740090 RepID=UPI0006D89679|nr:S41 family peptidase [Pedobacter sp. Hv1]KQC00329.1 hypothetical protein AQF98_12640 [Pedobacter sp. Hv1]